MVTHDPALAARYARTSLHMADGKLVTGRGGAAMKRQDLFELAARNMRNARLRNALTTMGIAVGVASLVAMLSLGIGLQGFANHQLMKSGMFQTVFVTSKQDIRYREQSAEDDTDAKPEESPVLNDDARKQIAALPGVEEVVPEVRAMAEVDYGDKTNFTLLARTAAVGARRGRGGKRERQIFQLRQRR